MKLSKRGEYALRALIDLGIAQELGRPILQVSELAAKEKLPVKFLEQIFAQLKLNGYVESTRGKLGGYSLAKPMTRIKFGTVIRLIDGPLAPFGDAEQLRELIDRDLPHRALYQVFLDVRDAAARILDHTTLADLIAHGGPRVGRNANRPKNQKKDSASILPMVVGGHKGE